MPQSKISSGCLTLIFLTEIRDDTRHAILPFSDDVGRTIGRTIINHDYPQGILRHRLVSKAFEERTQVLLDVVHRTHNRICRHSPIGIRFNRRLRIPSAISLHFLHDRSRKNLLSEGFCCFPQFHALHTVPYPMKSSLRNSAINRSVFFPS